MTLTEKVRFEMVQAMKEQNKLRKNALSALLASLKNEEINKRRPLTENEEGAVVKKEIKQITETLESAPKNRTDIITECEIRISVLKEFAPIELTEEQINVIIQQKLSELNITNPTKKDKGKVMKAIMPEVKGKADGGRVNQLIDMILE